MSRSRKERRELTEAIARRRWKRWVKIGLGGEGEWARPVHFYAKTKPWNCTCVKKRHGAPRLTWGICHLDLKYSRARVYRWRTQVVELNRKLARGHDPDDDVVANLSSPESVYLTGLWRA